MTIRVGETGVRWDNFHIYCVFLPYCCKQLKCFCMEVKDTLLEIVCMYQPIYNCHLSIYNWSLKSTTKTVPVYPRPG